MKNHLLIYISNKEEQKITPWEAHGKGGIDYNKLIQKFGSTAIDQTLIDRYLTSVPTHTPSLINIYEFTN